MSNPNERELANLSEAERAALADPEGDDTPAADDDGVTDEPSGAPLEGEKASQPKVDPPADPPAAAKPAEPVAAAKPADPPPPAEVVPPLRIAEVAPRAPKPADLDDQLKAVDVEQAALDKKLDDGEIESKEYAKESRKLGDKRQELRDIDSEHSLIARTNESARVQHWKTAQASFFDLRKDFGNPIMQGALDAALRDLYANPKYAGADYNWLLNKAAANVDAAMGKTATPAAPEAPTKPVTAVAQRARENAARAAADRAAVPTTLGAVPAAEANDPGAGGEFSHLDNLSGMELEKEIAKLPQEAAERYLHA